MDSGETRCDADPPADGAQQEEAQFASSCPDSRAQLEEEERFEEADFFQDCMEEFRIQFEECIDRLGAQFKGYADDTGDEFEDCAEDLPPHSTAGVDDLAADIEACMAELGLQLGCAERSGPQLQGLAEQTWSSQEDFLAWTRCVEPLGPWPEEYVEELESQLKEFVEEMRGHCESGVRVLGTRFRESIEEVAQLERRRDQLVQELLQLEEPMAQAVEALRAEVGELRRRLAQAELERWNLQEERRKVKRQLFTVARDCTESRVTLETQQHEVEQFATLQGELQGQVQQLTEEMTQLRESQQKALNALRSRLESLALERVQGDPSECRQAPWDLSSYLQDAMKALKEQYEPRLQALQKRKQAAADALLGTRAETQDLRAQLGPLREQAQRLGLQRTRLEEELALKRREREERVAQYRETVDSLEESSRELKTELQIQRKKNKEAQTLKDGLVKELDHYRGSTELCRKAQSP